mmetsp:Transcript_54906/g.59525  ORF Transcript_54906/g.59525 Transcript_54906/m.59525 type:complete len:142 (-) Transcript_54906:252-677(-)
MMMKCISIRVLMLVGVVGREDYLPFRKTTTFSKGMDVNITIRGEETLGLPGRGRDGDGGRGYDGGREGSGGSQLASNVPTVSREDCEDDTSYRLDGIDGKKDCDWVAKSPTKRCERMDSNEKKKVEFFCPRICSYQCVKGF